MSVVGVAAPEEIGDELEERRRSLWCLEEVVEEIEVEL